MFAAWIVFHVIICIALVLVVLLQSSKGEGLAGSAFGGGGGGLTGAVFGGRGAASFLSKATTVLAIVFMLNCGALAFMSISDRNVAGNVAGSGESVVSREAQKERDRALQQQQLQRQQAGDTSAIQNFDFQVTPNEAVGDTAAAVDTSGN